MFLLFLAIFTTTIAVDQTIHNAALEKSKENLVAAHIQLAEANSDLIARDNRLKAENKDLLKVNAAYSHPGSEHPSCSIVTPCKLNQK